MRGNCPIVNLTEGYTRNSVVERMSTDSDHLDAPRSLAVSKHTLLGSWEQRLWLFVSLGFGVCSLGLFGLVGYSLWQTLAWLQQPRGQTEQYVLNAVALTTLGILRYLAMLIGAALASGGLLVSFLTISQAIGASAKSGGATGVVGEFKTTSPGVVAILIGCIIIVSALFKRTELEITSGPALPGATARTPAATHIGRMPTVEEIRKSLSIPAEHASGVAK